VLLKKSIIFFFLHFFTSIFNHIQREVKLKVDHKSSVNAIIYMIDNCGMSPTDIEERTHISRTQVYRWRDGTVKKVRNSSLHSVAKALGFKIHHIDNKITTTRIGADNQAVMKGENSVMANNHYELLVNLQQEKIELLNKRLEKLKKSINKKKIRPIFHFKTEAKYDSVKQRFSPGKVEGDTSMTGYTQEELSKMTPEQWAKLYHKDSLKRLISLKANKPAAYVHFKLKHLMMRTKSNHYQIYNVETYYNVDDGLVRAYYYWIDGDLIVKA
tara:strand:+ start:4368 stop:5180 length:813 start_codon:yes stop_codon:yes gene_type:complete